MHRASNFTNIGQGAITIIVTNRGGQSNRKKGQSRLFNSIRISLEVLRMMELSERLWIKDGGRISVYNMPIVWHGGWRVSEKAKFSVTSSMSAFLQSFDGESIWPFEIRTFRRSDFKWSDLNGPVFNWSGFNYGYGFSYSPDHSKNGPFKIEMFVTRFQMVELPDFRSHSKSEPFGTQPLSSQENSKLENFNFKWKLVLCCRSFDIKVLILLCV